ncbi:hypothetical protein Y88_2261 [Novosphingobium nitrogenifigens DSM 19370]|uniref:Uncharacterized protein n=1 Tax=Novosphingobium nitrogenifigens DSM 19370 TaxID=983920 RepID=F1Z639_9SPHN|nr:hypothetical protein Y88_2261 [Novosphingobium nitrogenifigens DSM 19370]
MQSKPGLLGISARKPRRKNPQGTGSYPLPPHGWQRNSRFNASQLPRIAP